MKMSVLLTALVILSFNFSASAAKKTVPKKPVSAEQKVCEALQDEYDDECADIMCSDFKELGFGSYSDCVGGEDYAEAAQAACEELTPIEERAADYNRKHGTRYTCE